MAHNLGNVLRDLGKFQEAEFSYRKAIELNPNLAKAYENLGSIYTIKGEHSTAIINYKLAVQYDETSFQALSKMASSYNYLKEFSNAKIAAIESIDIKPKRNAFAYFELGVAEKGMGNIVAAKSAFEKASKDKKYRKSAKYELTLIEKGM